MRMSDNTFIHCSKYVKSVCLDSEWRVGLSRIVYCVLGKKKLKHLKKISMQKNSHDSNGES